MLSRTLRRWMRASIRQPHIGLRTGPSTCPLAIWQVGQRAAQDFRLRSPATNQLRLRLTMPHGAEAAAGDAPMSHLVPAG
jgi:hypothetical protein